MHNLLYQQHIYKKGLLQNVKKSIHVTCPFTHQHTKLGTRQSCAFHCCTETSFTVRSRRCLHRHHKQRMACLLHRPTRWRSHLGIIKCRESRGCQGRGSTASLGKGDKHRRPDLRHARPLLRASRAICPAVQDYRQDLQHQRLSRVWHLQRRDVHAAAVGRLQL